MKVTIPCECDAGEHEEYIEVELAYGRAGYNGLSPGDELPCGRKATQEDVDHIFEAINNYNVREDL